jgi:hypothetical protein
MRTPILLAIFVAAILLGCDNKPKSDPESAAPDRMGSTPVSLPSPAPEAPGSGDRASFSEIGSAKKVKRPGEPGSEFVRSAQLEFRCKSVVQATAAIEGIVAENGGFVALSSLTSRRDQWHDLPYGGDSVLEVQRISVENTMQLRVPNDRLDTVLANIQPLIVFLNSRTVRADDVKLELHRAQEESRRLDLAAQRLQALARDKSGHVQELARVDEQALQRQQQAAAAAAHAEGLQEQVELSAIQVALYQHLETRVDTLARPLEQIWREPIWRRFGRSLGQGAEAGLEVALWLVAHWILLFLLGMVGFLLYRRQRKSLSKERSSDLS